MLNADCVWSFFVPFVGFPGWCWVYVGGRLFLCGLLVVGLVYCGFCACLDFVVYFRCLELTCVALLFD